MNWYAMGHAAFCLAVGFWLGRQSRLPHQEDT